MRKIIAALRVSVDGFIKGPKGEVDWVDTWEDLFDLLPQIDTCIVGRGMYPGHKQYWSAMLVNPKGASKGEIAFAHFTERTPPYRLIQNARQGHLEEHADRSRHQRDPANETAARQGHVCCWRSHAGR